MSTMTHTCGCANKKDPRSWHRYHGVELCAEGRARDLAMAAERWRSRRLQAGPKQAPVSWIPGTEIDIPEHDPL